MAAAVLVALSKLLWNLVAELRSSTWRSGYTSCSICRYNCGSRSSSIYSISFISSYGRCKCMCMRCCSGSYCRCFCVEAEVVVISVTLASVAVAVAILWFAWNRKLKTKIVETIAEVLVVKVAFLEVETVSLSYYRSCICSSGQIE